MNTLKFPVLCGYVLLSLALVSCGTRAEPQPDLPPTTTNMPTLNVQATLVRTQPVTPTFPPPPPTLAFEIQDQLYGALQTNGGCELPCFLGVQPGKTNIQSTWKIFDPYINNKILPYKIKGENPMDGYLIFVDTSKDTTLDFTLNIMAAYDIVQGLIVEFHAPKKYDENKISYEDLSDRHLEHYGITDLFRRHGIPDEIYIIPPRTYDTIAGYGIDVIYNHSQIMAMYSGIAKLDENGKYKLCPAIGDGDIGGFMLAVAAPSVNDMADFFLRNRVKNFTPATLLSYRENTQKLDAQGIYDLFITQNQRCFYEYQFLIK